MSTAAMKWVTLPGAIMRPFALQNPVVVWLSGTFVALLLVTDVTMMFLHLVYWYTDSVSSDYFSISRERGYAEFFGYIKLLWLVLLFAGYAIRSREKSYFFWSAVFGYILLDDSFTIHERAGNSIRLNLEIPAQRGLRGADYGELIFYALLLGILLLSLRAVYYFSSVAFRQDSHYLLGLVALFGIFAGVGDVLHMLVRETFVFRVFDVLEDGGEMVVMSLIVWFALLLIARDSGKGADSLNQRA